MVANFFFSDIQVDICEITQWNNQICQSMCCCCGVNFPGHIVWGDVEEETNLAFRPAELWRQRIPTDLLWVAETKMWGVERVQGTAEHHQRCGRRHVSNRGHWKGPCLSAGPSNGSCVEGMVEVAG